MKLLKIYFLISYFFVFNINTSERNEELITIEYTFTIIEQKNCCGKTETIQDKFYNFPRKTTLADLKTRLVQDIKSKGNKRKIKHLIENPQSLELCCGQHLIITDDAFDLKNYPKIFTIIEL